MIIKNHKIVLVAGVADHWGCPQVTVKELEGSIDNLIRTSKRKTHVLTKATSMTREVVVYMGTSKRKLTKQSGERAITIGDRDEHATALMKWCRRARDVERWQWRVVGIDRRKNRIGEAPSPCVDP
jgi:hypothetical protein